MMIALIIIAFAAFFLVASYGIILKCNSEMREDRGDTEVFYVSRIGLVVTRIHFIVLAIPVVMATIFAVDNIINESSQLILATNFKMITATTIATCVIGALIQAIAIKIIKIQDSQDDDSLK